MTIGEAAKKARKKTGLTISQLAEKAGYSYNTVWNMENDIASTQISTVIDLADTLGISVDEYIGHEAKNKKPHKGKWIKLYPLNLLDGNYYCSVCREAIDIATGEETPLDRGICCCFNCGADMREGAEK